MDRDARWDVQRTSFGADASGYDAYRPGWPAETARWLTGSEDGGPLAGRPLRVLDVGAGTGKLTRTLVELGHDVIAVDPSPEMLAVLRSSIPGVDARQGVAERLPLEAASVDAVTAAQSWHWVDPSAASAECARVLVPGGWLGVGWHVRDDAVPWVGELNAIVGAPYDGTRETWEKGLTSGDLFGPVQQTTLRYEHRLTPASLVSLAASWSYVATAPERDRILADVSALAERVADPDGVLTLPHVTACYRAPKHR